jgi:hypothetical protein
MPERLLGIVQHPVMGGMATALIAAVSTVVGVDSVTTFLDTGHVPFTGLITAILAGIGAIFAGLAKFMPALGDMYIKIAQARVSENSIDRDVFCESQQELHDLNIKYYRERCLRDDCPTRVKVRLDKIKQDEE